MCLFVSKEAKNGKQRQLAEGAWDDVGILSENKLLTIEIPTQLPKGMSEEAITDQAKQVESLCWATIIIQLLLQMSMKKGKDKLFDLLMMLQLIDSMRIYDFDQSAVMQIIFQQLSSLLKLELMNPDYWLNRY